MERYKINVDIINIPELDPGFIPLGCGVKYFSQDAVIKLAPKAGISLPDELSPTEKLKIVQELIEKDDERAKKVYCSIGVYLGHTLAYYYQTYQFRHVLLLGRVMSGKGGEIIVENCKKVLQEEYLEVFLATNIALPDEEYRRIGQSMVAASLPEIN